MYVEKARTPAAHQARGPQSLSVVPSYIKAAAPGIAPATHCGQVTFILLTVTVEAASILEAQSSFIELILSVVDFLATLIRSLRTDAEDRHMGRGTRIGTDPGSGKGS